MVSEIEENPKLKTAISTKGSARRLKEKEESKARRLEKKEISGKAWKEIIKYNKLCQKMSSLEIDVVKIHKNSIYLHGFIKLLRIRTIIAPFNHIFCVV